MRIATSLVLVLAFVTIEAPATRTVAAPADWVPATEPADPVMATPAEVSEMADWVSSAFMGEKRDPAAAEVQLQVRRQDHSTLHYGQSVLDTPLTIGKRAFRRGLGTHANSEILVSVPAGAKAFKSWIGVDNNYDTAGQHGTVQFVVEIAGKEAFRSETLKGGNEPVEVNLPIPVGVEQIVLKTDATADGTPFDQSDWADAHFVAADGRQIWLDDQPPVSGSLAKTPPFSFSYGGQPSAALLARWERTQESKDLNDRTIHTVRWTDPQTHLVVTATISVIKRYPAVDWVLHFENQGSADTPLIENIQALDLSIGSGERSTVTLHRIAGDDSSERSFLPIDTPLPAGQAIRLAPVGGRSSNGTFPFFNFECEGQGLITAIGWTGQWAASLERSAPGPTRIRAGMELTHLILHPGEKIRSPRILLMRWQKDRTAAHNRFRRLMLFHYVPQENGRPLAIPSFWQNWNRYNQLVEWASEAGQIKAAQAAAAAGCEGLWFDAAWFVGHFPNGVGNWTPKPKEFPRGLKPVADECHRLGLKFILWFEPERVAPGTQIAREHPDFVFGGDKGGLFKLSDPAARKWMTDLLNQRISEFGLDWYRNDFNMDPLVSWRAADAPDRQGITEIRYVEGLYEMWDNLRASHPGLQIDNCASGSRRLDLEMCMRSAPLWQSDTGCAPGHDEWGQAQNYGLSLYLPLHQTEPWTPEAYNMRSTCTTGVVVEFDYLHPGYSVEKAREALAEARENRRYWYGDFYPLTPCSLAQDQFFAFQCHRADLNEGMVLAFRRRQCDTVGIIAELQAIDPAAKYSVELSDEMRQKTTRVMTGEDLRTNLPLRIPQRQASLLVRYKLLPP